MLLFLKKLRHVKSDRAIGFQNILMPLFLKKSGQKIAAHEKFPENACSFTEGINLPIIIFLALWTHGRAGIPSRSSLTLRPDVNDPSFSGREFFKGRNQDCSPIHIINCANCGIYGFQIISKLTRHTTLRVPYESLRRVSLHPLPEEVAFSTIVYVSK